MNGFFFGVELRPKKAIEGQNAPESDVLDLRGGHSSHEDEQGCVLL